MQAGNVSDSSVILANKVPFLEITYPIPHVLNNQNQHETFRTLKDVPEQGLNFYDEIVSIDVGGNAIGEKPNNSELSELVEILKGGVILNVYAG